MITMHTGPVWVLWWGGENYSRPSGDDLERFETLEDAAIEADNRLRTGNHFAHTFNYVRREPTTVLTPCVDESSTMEVYLDGDPDELIPDAVLRYDPNDTGEFVIAEDYEFVTRGRR